MLSNRKRPPHREPKGPPRATIHLEGKPLARIVNWYGYVTGDGPRIRFPHLEPFSRKRYGGRDGSQIGDFDGNVLFGVGLSHFFRSCSSWELDVIPKDIKIHKHPLMLIVNETNYDDESFEDQPPLHIGRYAFDSEACEVFFDMDDLEVPGAIPENDQEAPVQLVDEYVSYTGGSEESRRRFESTFSAANRRRKPHLGILYDEAVVACQEYRPMLARIERALQEDHRKVDELKYDWEAYRGDTGNDTPEETTEIPEGELTEDKLKDLIDDTRQHCGDAFIRHLVDDLEQIGQKTQRAFQEAQLTSNRLKSLMANITYEIDKYSPVAS